MINLLQNFRKVILFIFFFTLIITSTSVKTNSQDKGVRLSPAYLELKANSDEKVENKVEIEYINFSNADIEVFYKEFDAKYLSSKDSEILKKISIINVNSTNNKTILNFEIDTKVLLDKTYFFGYEVRFKNIKSQTNSVISEQIAINIPIILTVNKEESLLNPKPRILLESRKNTYFIPEEISIKTQIANPNQKVINFAGEIVFVTEEGEIFYTQKVSSDNNKLLPLQVIQKDIQPDINNIKKGLLPYFGKVKVYYRGIINNERHIQTNEIEFYLLPWQIIIGIFFIITALIISVILIKKGREDR